jgi:hypothetical protein
MNMRASVHHCFAIRADCISYTGQGSHIDLERRIYVSPLFNQHADPDKLIQRMLFNAVMFLNICASPRISSVRACTRRRGNARNSGASTYLYQS